MTASSNPPARHHSPPRHATAPLCRCSPRRRPRSPAPHRACRHRNPRRLVAAGLAWTTRTGERLAVHIGLGYRVPTPSQQRILLPAWELATSRCHIDPDTLTVYAAPTPRLHAYATGRASIAVTTGLVEHTLATRHGHAHLAAALAHELGHHATAATRWALPIAWWTAPWALTARTIRAVHCRLHRRRPPLLTGLTTTVTMTGLALSLNKHNWAVAGVIALFILAAAIAPPATAARARARARARPGASFSPAGPTTTARH